MDTNIYLNVKTGQLTRKLEAISRYAGLLAKELDEIENKYCTCGGELLYDHRELLYDDEPYFCLIKVCSRCGEKHLFTEENL